MPAKIGFVTSTRNDDYAGDMLQRQRASFEFGFQQLENNGLDSEWAIIEWNPQPGAAPLSEVLKFPVKSRHVSVCIVTVDPRFHRRYRGWRNKAVHVAAATNVGLRRLHAPMIVARPADVFYSNELVEWLVDNELDPLSMYRCDRVDVSRSVLDKDIRDANVFLAACRANVTMRHHQLDLTHLGIPNLHTNACGDFTLTGRELWHAIRGLEESRDAIALDVDSLALHGARAAGGSEVLLPPECCVYKIEHRETTINRTTQELTHMWRWLDRYLMTHGVSAQRQLLARMLLNYPSRKVAGMDHLRFPSFERNFLWRARRMAKGRGFKLNGRNWGLVQVSLPTKEICRAEWQQ